MRPLSSAKHSPPENHAAKSKIKTYLRIALSIAWEIIRPIELEILYAERQKLIMVVRGETLYILVNGPAQMIAAISGRRGLILAQS